MAALSWVLFALSTNLDNLVIGLSYGLRGIRVRLESGLLVSGLVLAGTLLSLWAGQGLQFLLPPVLARLLGSLVMAGLGLSCLWGVWKGKRGRQDGEEEEQWPQKHPERFDRDASRQIEWRESLALGGALALNNLGLGLGAGAAGMPVLAAGAAVVSHELWAAVCREFPGQEEKAPGVPAEEPRAKEPRQFPGCSCSCWGLGNGSCKICFFH